jgi:sec-independent protein translocase protein TatB
VFNIGPMEFVVLAAVALIVMGPDKLPQLTKDAARMLRTLRDLAQGARSQLNSELGPEFADFDLSSLNPRTAIKNALLGEDGVPRPDLNGLNPKEALSRAWYGADEVPTKPASPGGPAAGPGGPAAGPGGAAAAPPAPTDSTPYDTDAT